MSVPSAIAIDERKGAVETVLTAAFGRFDTSEVRNNILTEVIDVFFTIQEVVNQGCVSLANHDVKGDTEFSLTFWSTAEQLLEQQFHKAIGRRLCKEPLPIVLSEADVANEAPDAHFPVNQLGFKRCRNIPFHQVWVPHHLAVDGANNLLHLLGAAASPALNPLLILL
ncbi:hypothetical protein BM449_08910 [Synechococcus sp. SynAce01]|nr:hypothetical protein BM449_08910 [Synechococcus sp. SynAce01]